MIEQIEKIIKEQRKSHRHLVAVCSIIGNEEHSLHMLVWTDSDDPDKPTKLVDEDIEASIEDFFYELDTIQETIGGQVQAFIPNLWAFWHGYDPDEMDMDGLKEILEDAFNENFWSLNDEFGIGIRIEIK